ncbi:ferritin-like domain-containing protein [Spirosoma endbachense]|uniref:Ferritin-like domain-containing protein n=1 Tax=Spirosoma endbachense TaxID=2666025 RepID=A0A6P1VPP9_9BACT|nr:ferritin-like domain-containing protein [Spirosoma endbachense]QHV94594.1 ferritin-like domain-containing protein [Spirosoma endbachense]
MNLFKIISEIEQFDPEATERYSFYSRRNLIKYGTNLAAAAIPTLVATTFNQAFAQTATPPSAAAIEVANFALTLEYLEDEFYRTGLAAAGLVPAADKTVIIQISKHETAHVNLLKTALGAGAVAKPTFKFPAGTFTNYTTFLATARAFEDTGVQAYKGQAATLINDKDILQIALQIHSVEARHASEIRRMQGMKGWVSDTTQTSFTQAGINLKTLTGKSDDAIREAFDEPLTKDAVLAIVKPFLA